MADTQSLGDEKNSENSLQQSLNTDKKILLVDDNMINLLVAKAMLESIGFAKIESCENGLQAVNLFKKESFDLILMDCEMPEMDGYEATRLIRQIEQQANRSETPIVALTAHVLPEYLQRAKDVGMNDNLAKPLVKQKLINKLHLFL